MKSQKIIIIIFLVIVLNSCVPVVTEVVPTTMVIPKLTITPSPTFTPIVVTRLIPIDYYRIIKTKSTTFYNGEAKYICIQTNSHKATKMISDDVIEIVANSEYQSVIGDCFGTYPKQWSYQLNIYTGEFVETLEQGLNSNASYFGKNYDGNIEDLFSLSNLAIPVWKIITPISRKDVLDKIIVHKGTEESFVDKVTGILIYRIGKFTYVQDPAYTYIVETISLSTNAPVGGILNEPEFTYSIE